MLIEKLNEFRVVPFRRRLQTEIVINRAARGTILRQVKTSVVNVPIFNRNRSIYFSCTKIHKYFT